MFTIQNSELGRSVQRVDRRLCVAPMMDWTDRHCRYFHRLFSPHALLYTEMIVSAAIVRGNAMALLEFDPREQPVALQLGGSDPVELAKASRIGARAGFAEINLNVGCPSDRVKSGAFGACLMLRPKLVAECVRAMRAAVREVAGEGTREASGGVVPVTVKCRIGIDDKDSYEFFCGFVDQVADAGVDALIVHARAAILGGLGGASGLSPKQNREIPPLKYDYVHRLKAARPDLSLVINGGFSDLQSVRAELDRGIGVMLGRAAYHNPMLLAEVERAVFDPASAVPEPWQIIEGVVAYARRQGARGVRLHSISRHMHGLMAGRAGARSWRRFLSEVASRSDASADTLRAALPILKSGMAA